MAKDASARWRRRKEARPSEIVAAALESFAERGFAATRLEDVARRAGVSKGTLYLYFANKEELFKAVVRTALVPNIARAEAMLAEAQPSPSATSMLRQVLTMMGGIAVTSPLNAIPKLIIAEAGNFPDIARFYHDEVIRRGFALLAGILRRGIAGGEFRPVDVESAIPSIIGPLLITVLWRSAFEPVGAQRLDVEALFRTHIDLLIRGLSAEEGAA